MKNKFMPTYNLHKTEIDSYKIQGYLLKQISEDIKPSLEGVLEGVAVLTNEDATAEVYLIDDSEDDKTRLKPWQKYKDGEFTELKGRRFLVSPVVPPGKSVGMYVTKTGKLIIPLMA